MSYGKLSEYFSAIGYKRLSSHEIDPLVSNGHEFQGINSIKNILGTERLDNFPVSILYLSDAKEEPVFIETLLTWYDGRENKPTRSPEYRLYYKSDEIQSHCRPGDLFIFALKSNGQSVIIIAEKDSTFENQLIWLFEIDRNAIQLHVDDSKKKNPFRYKEMEKDESIQEVSKLILENLGIEIAIDDTYLDFVLEHYPTGFPSTREFSKKARSLCTDIDPIIEPDRTLMNWIEVEEKLFRTLEKHIVEKKLQAGISNVDEFISFSLSVQNRRKSRAGFALENHLEQIFTENKIPYTRGGVTEGKSKPDFIFPGITEYQNPAFASSMLEMLGVKYSCKERWRQILAEADRITNKHLFTLQPSISENQTNEMNEHKVALVIPAAVHETYTEKQQQKMKSLYDFLTLLRQNNYAEKSSTAD